MAQLLRQPAIGQEKAPARLRFASSSRSQGGLDVAVVIRSLEGGVPMSA